MAVARKPSAVCEGPNASRKFEAQIANKLWQEMRNHDGSSVMRPLRYSINITLDGCCDHRAIVPDEELHRYHAENIAPGRCSSLRQSDVRSDGGSMAAGGSDGNET